MQRNVGNGNVIGIPVHTAIEDGGENALDRQKLPAESFEEDAQDIRLDKLIAYGVGAGHVMMVVLLLGRSDL
jgi:hypothetical protein